MTNPEYGQACAHITRVAVLGMICSPYKEDISWLLLPLWANLSFCLICTPDQHTRSGRESCCDMAIPFSYTFQQNPHVLFVARECHTSSFSASTQGPQSPVPSEPWPRGWMGTPFPCEPVQNGNQPRCSCVLIHNFLACEQHRHFLWFHFRPSAEEAKSPPPWKEKEEHRAKLLVQINSAV